jgi:hypothetical protein
MRPIIAGIFLAGWLATGLPAHAQNPETTVAFEMPLNAENWKPDIVGQNGIYRFRQVHGACQITFSQNLGADAARAAGRTPHDALDIYVQRLDARFGEIARGKGPDLKLRARTGDPVVFPTVEVSRERWRRLSQPDSGPMGRRSGTGDYRRLPFQRMGNARSRHRCFHHQSVRISLRGKMQDARETIDTAQETALVAVPQKVWPLVLGSLLMADLCGPMGRANNFPPVLNVHFGAVASRDGRLASERRVWRSTENAWFWRFLSVQIDDGNASSPPRADLPKNRQVFHPHLRLGTERPVV